MNFVDTEWGNWGTVLRIEVTSESPDANCGNGNQCVVVNVNSDSADDTLKVQAYRKDTPAGGTSNENVFVAAVKLVELETNATNVKDSNGNDIPVYMHPGGGVASLQVDEEDEVEIEFGNLRSSIDVENEAPEIDNFSPAHEMAFDDADVDYAFTITDAQSGLPEPEDLPDMDGDDAYTPVVALISRAQCETHSGSSSDIQDAGRRSAERGGACPRGRDAVLPRHPSRTANTKPTWAVGDLPRSGTTRTLMKLTTGTMWRPR